MSDRRRYLQGRQRATRRAAQLVGQHVAALVRQRREQLSAGTPPASGVPPHAGDGLPQAVAGPSPSEDDAA